MDTSSFLRGIGIKTGLRSVTESVRPGLTREDLNMKELSDMTSAVATTGLTMGTWDIDPVHSSIGFSVRHLMVGKVRGNFNSFSGAIIVAEDGIPALRAEIAVDSVDSGNEQRDAHIKAADFFAVEQYPTATFVSTGLRVEGNHYLLDGEFTLKGVTKPITLDLEFNGVSPGMGRGEVAGFEASVALSRKSFGVGGELPLQSGGVLVGDKVSITLAIEAIKQA